ncbi:hypothetical protein TeGR_g1470 [Tetraparma gracilis]|uniref:ABC1 atypical kinase-like domain-containing protein n=2 Tax=Tetraparma gracilis TaxID=2962635 RepID=A0ABQ6M5Z1_9STRA|nr:hypothetical protein TeGR_g1470 [Tetraparma gracilis]
MNNLATLSAVSLASAAVNAAVAMKDLSAPSLEKSYISLDSTTTATDESGLPEVYNAELIQDYWKSQRGTLNKRWGEFVGLSVPFLTRLTSLFITEGGANLGPYVGELSRSAREILQELGPTFVKLGQMMSVRPDVLPEEALTELGILQDSVEAFPTSEAVAQIESSLGGPLSDFFLSISEEPVAAASLAQVYRAVTLNNETVAVKVQRPKVLSQVSKDLYVLRRAAEVYQGLVDRFAPQQRTDYVSLLNEFAVGFYTELDFVNEGKNQEKLRTLLLENNVTGVLVPRVYSDLSTRRVLVSEWVDGVKLSTCTPEEIKATTAIAQEAFLVQLLSAGFFHADPHPGNILKLNSPGPAGESLALIDCGLMASISSEDRDIMISALIHLANGDYAKLVDDFISLKILPTDCDRRKVVPLMDKALTPYVAGGGAKKRRSERRRAIITLEGVALTGDPNYGIIREAYPFIARRLLRDDRPVLQQALNEILYSSSDSGGLKISRLISLIGNAACADDVAQDGCEVPPATPMIDLDAPKNIQLDEGLKFVFSASGTAIRKLLITETTTVSDLVVRQLLRKSLLDLEISSLPTLLPKLFPALPSLPPPPSLPSLPFGLPLPSFLPPLPTLPSSTSIPIPIPLPGGRVALKTLTEFVDAIAPPLSRDEELYVLSVTDVISEMSGADDLSSIVSGNDAVSAETLSVIISLVTRGGLSKKLDLGDRLQPQVLEQITQSLSGLVGGNAVEASMEEIAGKLSDGERENLDGFIDSLLGNIVATLEGRAAALAA